MSGEDALLKSDHPHPDAGGLPARWVVRPARSRRGPALECEPPALRCGHAQYWALDGRRRLSSVSALCCGVAARSTGSGRQAAPGASQRASTICRFEQGAHNHLAVIGSA